MKPLHSLLVILSALLTVIPLTPREVLGQCEQVRIVADDGKNQDSFGESVSVCGGVAVSGARLGDSAVLNSGAAYVYRRNGFAWVFEAKLVASDAKEGDFFGTSVSAGGDVVVVGAPGDKDRGIDSGSAYVYRWNGRTWVEEQKLVASDAASDDQFGFSVSVSGDVIVVGAFQDDDRGLDSGSTYVYRWNGTVWFEEQKLVTADQRGQRHFGRSVSVSGDAVAVGARGDSDLALRAGAAYVYRWDGNLWVEEQKLYASDGAAADTFGGSVAVSGLVLVVGSLNDTAGRDSGAAYVYRWRGGTWVEEQKLLSRAGGGLDSFGISVSTDENCIVVGAPSANRYSGSSYVYRWNGTSWLETEARFPDSGSQFSRFGGSVSVNENLVMVGATSERNASGAVYLDVNLPNGREGTVNVGVGRVTDVLFLNGRPGDGPDRIVEYGVLEPLELSMRLPPAVDPGEVAPFAVYLWSGAPSPENLRILPWCIGYSMMPMPISGGSPQPVSIWNNAHRFQKLGVPTRDSTPAPSVFFRREQLRRVGVFFIQGLIFDPGSVAEVPASVTNGIVGRPSF